MFFDTHIHSKFSSDSKMELEDAMGAADRLGLGMILTEHYDDTGGYAGHAPMDCGGYFKEYAKYRSEKLCLGIEIGLTKESIEINRRIYESYDFDYVLGAVHITNGKDICVECLSNPNAEFSIERYLLDNIEMVEKNSYIQSLAHIDYISRYGSWKDVNAEYKDYAKLYDRLFEALLDNDCLIEVNSRRLTGETDCCNYLYDIYARYKEMGGRYVTIGSDAHSAGHIGINFKNAMDLVANVGLTPVYFSGKHMHKCDAVGMKAYF